ncbi:MAG: Stp1/IreP family PP2C-type Ser/Thr phosphatase [Oscillospiraceae bacterium]|nr:Stp1/IreP family PP2C-type Ser/Thr phosphatase [Oscillospiraceae bacterium]
MNIYGMTDIGLVRKENQDTYGIAEMPEMNYAVAVVCDGMGGAKGGQVASALAVETYIAELRKILTFDMMPEQLREASSYAVSQANAAVYAKGQESEELSGMGTTLVSAIAYPGGVLISNVGDSRAYSITESGIRQISRDHSLVEDMIARGDITAEEARRHPNKNVITRALGPEKNIQCDGFIHSLESKEFILLCSDGLVDTVTDQEILFEVWYNQDVESCLDRLLAIAKSRGAADNVTAVLLRNA